MVEKWVFLHLFGPYFGSGPDLVRCDHFVKSVGTFARASRVAPADGSEMVHFGVPNGVKMTPFWGSKQRQHCHFDVFARGNFPFWGPFWTFGHFGRWGPKSWFLPHFRKVE